MARRDALRDAVGRAERRSFPRVAWSIIGALACVGLTACATPPVPGKAIPLPDRPPAAGGLSIQRASYEPVPLSALLDRAFEGNPRLVGARRNAAEWASRAESVGRPEAVTARLRWRARRLVPRRRATQADEREFLLAQQIIPWPTKLDAEREAVEIEAELADVRAARASRDVLIEIARSFVELRRDREIVETGTEAARMLARAGAPADAAIAAAVAEARARLDRTRATLAGLLGESGPIDRLPARMDAPPLTLSADDLFSEAITGNPDVRLLDLEMERVDRLVKRDRLRSFPDLTVGGRYFTVDRQQDTDPRDTVTDTFFLQLGIVFPLRSDGARARRARARVTTEALSRRRNAMAADLFERIVAGHRTALSQFAKRIEADEAADNAARARDEAVGASDPRAVTAIRDWVRAARSASDARAAYARTLLDLEHAVGAPLRLLTALVPEDDETTPPKP